MYRITFQFENGGKPVIVDATPNTTILDAAKAANVAIDAPLQRQRLVRQVPGQNSRGHR